MSSAIWLITQQFGGSLHDINMWLSLPLPTIAFFINKKVEQSKLMKARTKEYKNKFGKKKKKEISMHSQLEAELEFLKSSMSPEDFEKLDLNAVRKQLS